MKELELKYGCNPNQKPSRIFMEDGTNLHGKNRTNGRSVGIEGKCSELYAV